MMTKFMHGFDVDQVVEKGDVFRDAFVEFDLQTDNLQSIADRLTQIKEQHPEIAYENQRLKDNINKAMYEAVKKTKDTTKAPVVKLRRVLTTMIQPEDLVSDNDSKTNKSRTSKITKVSRMTGRDDVKKRSENEVRDKIYMALQSLNGKLKRDLDLLLEEAKKNGESINSEVEKTIEDMLDAV